MVREYYVPSPTKINGFVYGWNVMYICSFSWDYFEYVCKIAKRVQQEAINPWECYYKISYSLSFCQKTTNHTSQEKWNGFYCYYNGSESSLKATMARLGSMTDSGGNCSKTLLKGKRKIFLPLMLLLPFAWRRIHKRIILTEKWFFFFLIAFALAPI